MILVRGSYCARNKRSVQKTENAKKFQIFIEKRAFGQEPNAREFFRRALALSLCDSVNRFVDLPKRIRKNQDVGPKLVPAVEVARFRSLYWNENK